MAKIQLLIEDPDPDYKINDDDLSVYAKQIGIDVENEQNLLWIAEQGLAANVPEPWLILCDEKDRIFYFNIETGEKSWLHPLDKDFAALVVKERNKCKNSSLSDCGFESKLSSLSDAPPLSSSSKNVPPSLKHGSNINPIPKKLDLGHFENRRGTKLAPVRLNNLKMPPSVGSQKTGSGMSFMPKGASLSKNIRRVTEEQDYNGSQLVGNKSQMHLAQDDYNESLNSDEGSKYSYEETDDDDIAEKSYDDMNQSDIDSHLSPTNSADDSPEAFDINSLVKLGAKLPTKLEDTKKLPHFKSRNEEQPSLNLRKGLQPSYLKPLQPAPQKKAVSKVAKKSKKTLPLSSKCDQNDAEKDLDYAISMLNEEQKSMLDNVQKEWANMQKDLEKEEKVKYEKLVNENSKRYEDEESLLRKQNEEKLSKLKIELRKKIEDEENAGEISLAEIKKANNLKYSEEQQNFNEQIKSLTENQKIAFEELDQKNVLEITEKKKKLEDENQKEIEDIQNIQQMNIEKVKEEYEKEIAFLEEAHKEKLLKIQGSDSKDRFEQNTMENEVSSSVEELNAEIQKTKELLKEEKEKYQNLLEDFDKLKTEVEAKRENLQNLEAKTTAAQACYEEIQDEVDKTENDLDLLRAEKSALVSELNILKGNIKNEKTNLQIIEKQLESPVKQKIDLDHKAVNTDSYSMMSQAVQVCVELINVSCQIREPGVSKKETFSQTCFDNNFECVNAAIQVNLLQHETDNTSNAKDATKLNFSDAVARENTNIDSIISKVLENAIMEVNNKMEARFKSIENLVGIIQKNVDSSGKGQAAAHDASSSMANSNSFPPSDALHQNDHPNVIANRILPVGNMHSNTFVQGQRKCNCERGDSDSCDIMQDVKQSIHRFNDILSSSLVPSINKNLMMGYNYPVSANYSTCLESFYSQFQKLQERQRIADLKHKCQNNATRQQRNLLHSSGSHLTGGREQANFTNFLNSSPYSINTSDDPVTRARNLVVREQARSWKQQQQFLTTESQDLLSLERAHNVSISDNISQSESRISSSFGERSPVRYPFLRFGEEIDPEAEYNEWMARLKSLQDKIQSHKFL